MSDSTLPAAAEDHEPVNVVVQTDDGAVSLLVDEIGDVLEVTETAIRAPAGNACKARPAT